ncbi:unnamed protein product [Amoebophrya sp. A120]|nr:unnamed protein product [Amoebophrya sp. A120]|eukprot:GSA120T00008944001.1
MGNSFRPTGGLFLAAGGAAGFFSSPASAYLFNSELQLFSQPGRQKNKKTMPFVPRNPYADVKPTQPDSTSYLQLLQAPELLPPINTTSILLAEEAVFEPGKIDFEIGSTQKCRNNNSTFCGSPLDPANQPLVGKFGLMRHASADQKNGRKGQEIFVPVDVQLDVQTNEGITTTPTTLGGTNVGGGGPGFGVPVPPEKTTPLDDTSKTEQEAPATRAATGPGAEVLVLGGRHTMDSAPVQYSILEGPCC